MLTVALDECEVNEYSDKIEKFVDELNDLLGSLSPASFLSVEETEGRVSERIRSLG